MDDLVQWLRAQIAETELRALLFAEDFTVVDAPEDVVDAVYDTASRAAMLAQCDAHTALLDLCTPSEGEQLQLPPQVLIVMDSVVQDVGLAYQHNPGYREEWRP